MNKYYNYITFVTKHLQYIEKKDKIRMHQGDLVQ